MSEISNPMIKEAIKYGAIIAVVSFIVQLLLYVVDYTLLASIIYQLSIMVILIVVLVWVGMLFRKQQGGYLSYGSAYGFLMLTTVATLFVGTIFSWVMYNVIAPDLPELLQEIQIEQTIDMYESFNATDEQIDEAVTQAEKQNVSDISVLLQGVLFLSFIFAVINLVLALFVKKSRPDFE